MKGISPELALAIDCCRVPSSDAAHDRDLRHIDWALFGALVRRHRIQGLAWRALKHDVGRLPAQAAAALSAGASEVARENFRFMAEARRLQRAFERESVELLFVKGVALGKLAYGDPLLKSARDIDLLVRYEAIEAAADLLDAAGYQLIIPKPAARERLAFFHRYHKESVWFHPGLGMHLDLHTALVDHPMLLPRLDPFAATQMVDLGAGLELPTLARDELFAYLCVHGASSAWFRLKWIADLEAFLGDADEREVRRLYERSQELGAGRSAGLALALSSLLFGRAQLGGIERSVGEKLALRALLRISLASLSGRLPLLEPNQKSLGTVGIHLTQFLLLPGLPFLAKAVRREFERARLKSSFPIN